MSLWDFATRAARDAPYRLAAVELDAVGRRTLQAVRYGELEARARSLALFLRARGVEAGECVALLDDNTLGFVVTSFAVAGLGAILVPLNTRLRAEDMAQAIASAGARWLCVGSGRAESARALGALGALEHVAWLAGAGPGPGADGRGGADGNGADDEPAGAQAFVSHRAPAGGEARTSVVFEPARVSSDTPAQLYFTSGSSGRPKGVVLTHGNVASHAEAAIEALALTRDDVWAHYAPMFHLADAWATFAITRALGRHVLLPRFTAEAAVRVLEQQRVTLTNLIPTMLARVLAEPALARADRSSLRLVLTGGAPIAPAVVRRTMEVLGCEYAQTYGMTETSPYLTLGLLPPHLAALPFEEQLVWRAKTGRPFAAVELRVVGEDGEPVPADGVTVGEIQARGPTVTPGYWRDEEATRAAFDGGWLKTGDLSVVDSEGFLDIVGRRKEMIITGGEKVFPVEVERALYAHADVLEAAVYGVPDAEWGETVEAAVAPRPGRELDAEALRDHCRAELAAYKVPKRIRVLGELPRLGSGKIAKQELAQAARSICP